MKKIEIYDADFTELENWAKEHQVSIAEVVKEVLYLYHYHVVQDIED